MKDTYRIDDMIDAGQTLPFGADVCWHGHNGRLIKLSNDRPAIRTTIPCGLCYKEHVTITVVSGCHSGAFCYVVEENNPDKIIADLRNQTAACQTCTGD